jgi:hypothetical protein
MNGLPVLAALLISSQPVGWPPVSVGGVTDGRVFKGGPYGGLSVGTATTPDGMTLRALKPSSPGSSPVSPQNQAAVSAFIAGYANPTAEPLASFLKENTTFAFCRIQGQACSVLRPTPLAFQEKVQPNTPYRMEFGKVRIEWVYGTAVWYITELTLRSGKITYVKTQPGWLPMESKRR